MRKGTVVALLAALCACDGSSPHFTQVSLVQEQAVAFGVARGDAPTTRTIAIQKPLLPEAEVALLDEMGPFVPVPGQLPGDAPAGSVYELEVTYTPPATAGATPLEGSITLEFRAGDLVLDVAVDLRTSIEVPDLVLLTKSVAFGKVALGEEAALLIAVENPNEITPIEISAASLGGSADLSLDLSSVHVPYTVPPGESFRVPVRYRPSAVGPVSGTVTVTSPLGQLTIQVAGEGIVGEVVLFDDVISLDADGESDDILLDVSPEVVSLAFYADTQFGGIADVSYLAGPDGRLYENGSFTGPWFWFAGFPDGFYTALSTVLPNSDDPQGQLVRGGGAYTLRMQDTTNPFGLMYLRITAERRRAGAATKGTLPMNVWLAAGLGISPADAPGDLKLQTALKTMDETLGQVHLRLGEVTYHVIDDPYFDDIHYSYHLEELFFYGPAYAGTPAPMDPYRLNLFFVKSYDDPLLLGEAGGLPGPKVPFANPWNGVSVSYTAQTPGPLGLTAAHEACHQLGLLHTISGDGLSADLIEDTEICPVYGTSSACPVEGNDYLMHPFALPNGDVLTPGEGLVILRHPLIEPGLPDAYFGTQSPLAAFMAPVDPAVAALAFEVEYAGCGTCRRLAQREGR